MPHIRKPTKRTFRTSSSGFVRRAGISGDIATLCGAEITALDVAYADRKWFVTHGDCADCARIAEAS